MGRSPCTRVGLARPGGVAERPVVITERAPRLVGLRVARDGLVEAGPGARGIDQRHPPVPLQSALAARPPARRARVASSRRPLPAYASASAPSRSPLSPARRDGAPRGSGAHAPDRTGRVPPATLRRRDRGRTRRDTGRTPRARCPTRAARGVRPEDLVATPPAIRLRPRRRAPRSRAGDRAPPARRSTCSRRDRARARAPARRSTRSCDRPRGRGRPPRRASRRRTTATRIPRRRRRRAPGRPRAGRRARPS